MHALHLLPQCRRLWFFLNESIDPLRRISAPPTPIRGAQEMKMNRFKKRIAKLVAIPAAALAMVGWASTAQADDYYNSYSYSPYDRNYDGYLDAAERHEAQHDSNRNGRLDAWEHESLHRHD